MRPESQFSKHSDEMIFHEPKFVTCVNLERVEEDDK